MCLVKSAWTLNNADELSFLTSENDFSFDGVVLRFFSCLSVRVVDIIRETVRFTKRASNICPFPRPRKRASESTTLCVTMLSVVVISGLRCTVRCIRLCHSARLDSTADVQSTLLCTRVRAKSVGEFPTQVRVNHAHIRCSLANHAHNRSE